MDEVSTNEPRRATRVALLALGAGLLWAGASLILGMAPANAADGDRPDGLVGLVTSVTDGASEVVNATTDVVAEVLPPAAPVTTVVTDTVSTVTGGTADVVATVPAVVPDVSPVVTPVVETVVQPVVDEVVQPVVDAAAELTAPVPVVGDVVGAIDLSGTVAMLPGVTDAVDGAVDGVLGGDSSEPGTVLPPGSPGGLFPVHPDGHAPSAELSLTAIASDGESDLAASTRTITATSTLVGGGLPFAAIASSDDAAAVIDDAVDRPTDHPVGGLFPPDSAPPTSGASPGNPSSSSGAAAELFTPLGSWLLRGTLLPPGDDLPGCPVFDTDTSPD